MFNLYFKAWLLRAKSSPFWPRSQPPDPLDGDSLPPWQPPAFVTCSYYQMMFFFGGANECNFYAISEFCLQDLFSMCRFYNYWKTASFPQKVKQRKPCFFYNLKVNPSLFCVPTACSKCPSSSHCHTGSHCFHICSQLIFTEHILPPRCCSMKFHRIFCLILTPVP